MIETYIDTITTIRERRERMVRGDEQGNGLDSLIDVGQGAECRVGRGIVNDDCSVDPRVFEALALGKSDSSLYISA